MALRVVPFHLQVQHFTWSALQHLKWSTGDRLLTVADALALVQQQVQLVIIDVKASPDVNRVGAVCCTALLGWQLVLREHGALAVLGCTLLSAQLALQQLKWSTGDRLLTAADALALVCSSRWK